MSSPVLNLRWLFFQVSGNPPHSPFLSSWAQRPFTVVTTARSLLGRMLLAPFLLLVVTPFVVVAFTTNPKELPHWLVLLPCIVFSHANLLSVLFSCNSFVVATPACMRTFACAYILILSRLWLALFSCWVAISSVAIVSRFRREGGNNAQPPSLFRCVLPRVRCPI